MLPVPRFIRISRSQISRYLSLFTVVGIVLTGCSRDVLQAPGSDPRLTAALSPITGYQLVSKLDSTQAYEFSDVVWCPSGTVLGGGVANNNYDLMIRETYPYSGGYGWVFSLSRQYLGPVKFTGWAICASMPSGYVLRSVPGTMDPQTVGYAGVAYCPFGKRVLSGGVQNVTNGVVITSSYPTANPPYVTGWAYSLYRRAGSGTVNFTGWAVCADSTISGYEWVSKPDSFASGYGATHMIVGCPVGKHALGGGAGTSDTRLAIEESAPYTNGDGWVYSVSSEVPVGPVSMLGFAVCAT